ncbi:MAG: hypothetical protein ACLUEK_13515 [Oscillospiraceae bacterium]
MSATTAASSPSTAVSLQARAGEVLGIAAIEGNGQSELLEP